MTLECIGQRAKEAEPILRVMTREEKDRVLLKAAELLVREQEKILAANEKDMQAGQERGMKPGLLDRLKLTKDRIAGMAEGDPAGEQAQRAADLHRQWLIAFWKDGQYSPAAHKGMVEMYVADERFRKYYEAMAPGAAEFLREAVLAYCS